MIKKGIFIITILGMGMISMAQDNIVELAKEIVSNNLSIQALALENQMMNLENKEALIPDDPEVGIGYLWGAPAFIGNRTDLDVSQRIKFPTYYAKRKNVNELSASLYKTQMDLEINQVLFEALDIIVDLTSLSDQKILLTERLDRLQQIFELANQKFKAGEANRIEVEKAQLMVDTYKQDLLLIISEEKILHLQLIRLNANQSMVIPKPESSAFLSLFGAPDGGQALLRNPALQAAEMNSQLAEAGIALAKTSRMPDILIGYTSESINSEKLAGVEMGLSIPLWGKANHIKKAKLKKELFDKRLTLTSQIIQNDWDSNDEMAKQSLEIKENLEASLGSMKTKFLLEESWHLGEISLLDYLKELPFFYSVEDRVIEAKKQFSKALLNKNRYHLQELILN